jgi:hypothetical protein
LFAPNTSVLLSLISGHPLEEPHICQTTKLPLVGPKGEHRSTSHCLPSSQVSGQPVASRYIPYHCADLFHTTASATSMSATVILVELLGCGSTYGASNFRPESSSFEGFLFIHVHVCRQDDQKTARQAVKHSLRAEVEVCIAALRFLLWELLSTLSTFAHIMCPTL